MNVFELGEIQLRREGKKKYTANDVIDRAIVIRDYLIQSRKFKTIAKGRKTKGGLKLAHRGHG